MFSAIVKSDSHTCGKDHRCESSSSCLLGCSNWRTIRYYGPPDINSKNQRLSVSWPYSECCGYSYFTVLISDDEDDASDEDHIMSAMTIANCRIFLLSLGVLKETWSMPSQRCTVSEVSVSSAETLISWFPLRLITHCCGSSFLAAPTWVTPTK